MDRGSEVIVISYRGIPLQRRVWEVVGPGVLVCSEEEYKRAVRFGEEPQTVGFPKQDVLMANDGRAQVPVAGATQPAL